MYTILYWSCSRNRIAIFVIAYRDLCVLLGLVTDMLSVSGGHTLTGAFMFTIYLYIQVEVSIIECLVISK